ncbi:MAG: hypothetical protein WBA07_13575 [Rivularia sp. (in: cyanobacteria)]
MNAKSSLLYKRNDGYIRNSILILIAFGTVFFPRILDAVGFPTPINFVHFFFVPLACSIVIFKTKVKDKTQISIAKHLLFALFLLFIVMTASAFVNQAGVINIFVGYLLLAEPYLLLLAIISLSMNQERLNNFRYWMLSFALIHLCLGYLQKIFLDIGILSYPRMTKEDNIQGVFYLSGGGHVVSAFVSMSFSLYYFVSAKQRPTWLRGGVIFAAFMLLLFADAKQIIIVWLIAWIILILTQVKNIKATLQYLIAAIIILAIFYWCVENIELFRAFKTWIRPEIYGPEGDATVLKFGSIRIILSHYKSFLNWFVGLGPGHTVGRLGGWMLVDYSDLLSPFGATTHPSSLQVWATWRGYYLDSSFFSPLWGWVGIWGDSGFLGLAAYLYICSIVWNRLCVDDFSRFMLLTVIVNGFVFTQMEEPGYMLTVTTLIGLRWHEHNIARTLRRHSLQLSE